MILSKRAAEIFEKINQFLLWGYCSCTSVEEVTGQAGRDSYAHHSRARHSFEGFQDLPTFSEMSSFMRLAIRRERVADWLEWLDRGNQLDLYPALIKPDLMSAFQPLAIQTAGTPLHTHLENISATPQDQFRNSQVSEIQAAQQASQQGEKRAAGRSNVSTDQRERVIVAESQPRASASQAKDDVHRAILSGDPVIRSCVHQLVPTLGLHQLYSLVEQLYHLRYLEREARGENMRTTVQALGGDQAHD